MGVDDPSSSPLHDIETKLVAAVNSRASYIRANTQSITLVNVRRLLEDDLGLERFALDSHKSLIRKFVDKVLIDTDNSEPSSQEDKNNVVKEVPLSNTNQRQGLKDSVKKQDKSSAPEEESLEEADVATPEETLGEETFSDDAPKKKHKNGEIRQKVKKQKKTKADDSGGEEDLEDEAEQAFSDEAPKKKRKNNEIKQKVKKPKKAKADDSGGEGSLEEEAEQTLSDEAPKKNKKNQIKPKVKKQKKTVTEDSGEVHMPTEASEDDSENSSEKKHHKAQGKKSSDSKPIQSKTVERLRKVIKACGLGIPPSIYKKVKQAPEENKEAVLVKELEAILNCEGLSSNPSDKEIKAVKRRRDKEKDLEGIDTTNIILEPRRRGGAFGFLPPPKYVEPVVEYESEEENFDSSDGVENLPEDGASSGEEGSR